MNTALHGIRVTVAPADAEAAREILEESSPESSAEAPPPDEVCPSCNSERVGPPTWKKRLKALAIFFFPVLLVYPLFLAFSRKSECYACGHRWNPPAH